jgi:dTDP-4-dehydrorhamnose 3,5-epimerase
MAHLPRLDDTERTALADVATVSPDGSRLEDTIDGVRVVTPVVHSDHRGRVFEVHAGPDDFWVDPLVYCYAFTVRHQQTKGWGLHREKDDRYTLITGELLTLLYDARVDSPTHGVVQKVVLSEQGARSLRIPMGVWHMNLNIAQTETHLINHPTRPYVHGRPDRLLLPWDTAEIPCDVSAYFPVQMAGRTPSDR